MSASWPNFINKNPLPRLTASLDQSVGVVNISTFPHLRSTKSWSVRSSVDDDTTTTTTTTTTTISRPRPGADKGYFRRARPTIRGPDRHCRHRGQRQLFDQFSFAPQRYMLPVYRIFTNDASFNQHGVRVQSSDAFELFPQIDPIRLHCCKP